LEAPGQGSVAMRLLAEEAGQVIVTLNVTWAPSDDDEHLLTDSITVQVQQLSTLVQYMLVVY